MDSSPKFNIGQAIDSSKFELDCPSLTNHAIILGATGSGKTVLSKVIVEEAALQGIATFAIDPKGDVGSLVFRSANFDFGKVVQQGGRRAKARQGKICGQPANKFARAGCNF